MLKINIKYEIFLFCNKPLKYLWHTYLKLNQMLFIEFLCYWGPCNCNLNNIYIINYEK